jgi:hypothetical protein
MARDRRRAPLPTPAVLEAGKKAREDERKAARAVPGFRPSTGHECEGALFKALTDRVVDAGKGEHVKLCPHKGATKALVQAGHLVHVPSTAKVEADNKKEADHG